MNNLRNISYLNKKRDALIFLHLPKTAGTTVDDILKRQYRSENVFRTDPERHFESLRIFREFSDEEKCKFQLITGHMRFGVHQHIKKPSYYITFLRDPIQRIVSYYYYVLNYRNHYLHEKIKFGNMRLIDVVESGISREFENCQTRGISGFDRSKLGKYGYPSDEMLDVALKNIDQYFLVAGTTEKFDETLLLMSKFCRWNIPYYTKLNIGKNKPLKRDISDQAIKTITHFNELDIKLYDYVSRKLQGQISDFGPAFSAQMKMFRAINYSYGLVHLLRHRAR
jgi:hypothetical protein